MDVIYLFRVLLRRKWIIIITSLVAVAIAYFFTKNQPKNYKSSAQVSTGFTVSDDIKVNSENFSVFEADMKFNNTITTWNSSNVLSLLSYRLILHDLDNPRPFRTVSAEWQKSNFYKEINFSNARNVYESKLETMTPLTSFNPEEKKLLELLNLYGYDYKSLSKSLAIYRLQMTDYIQIDFMSENPELSAFVVNTVFQEALRNMKNVRSNKSQESIDTLQSLMEKKKQELDQKNALLRQNGSVDPSLENSSNLDLIMNTETTLTEARSNQTTLQYSLQKVNQKIAALNGGQTAKPSGDNGNDELLILRKATSEAYTAYVNSGSSDPALLKKYTQLKADYEKKVTQYQELKDPDPTAKSPEVAKAELLDKKTDIESDIQASNANIQILQERINSLKGNLTKDEGKRTVIETLLKDVELANKEYLSAKQKYTDAVDITSSAVTNFRQILYGQPAIEPEPSKRVMIVGMAGVSAFVVTVLIIVLLAAMDSSIKTPLIFSKAVGLRMISMVNFINLRNKDLSEITTKLDTVPDALNNKRHNVFREALRKLRYEIESSGKKIFLFASTKKGTGKSTLIQALSFSMSLSKKKILIVDTNFCNNDLTIRLEGTPVLEKIHPNRINPGLLLEQVRNAAKEVRKGYVYIIGCEGGDYTPSEILPKENLLQHLHTLTAEYDYIFLEAPPLNDFSDAKELTQYVDGVVAIFSAMYIIKQIDKESIEFFNSLNGKFCGAVLNMVDLDNVNVT
jgi:succinoglycan biosynthesis transport protein ExoP